MDPETRAMSRMIRRQHANVFEQAYAGTVKRALDSDAFVKAALEMPAGDPDACSPTAGSARSSGWRRG